MFRADLHCHSTCSDGTLTPTQLVNRAHQMGLQGLSITDHDSIDAYPLALEEAKKVGLEVIPGVEFSTDINQFNVHILAYGFQIDAPPLKKLCEWHKNRRIQRNTQILEKLRIHGMPITEEELMQEGVSSSVIGRPHIALALVRKGYVENMREAFKKFIGEGKSCYAKGESYSTEETVKIIHASGGLAVIAHPHLIHNNKVLKNLLKLPFDGIECYYARYPAEAHERWLKIAQEKGWLITGGSDFHGANSPGLELGCSWTPEASFHHILHK